jgi:hypothetical protein
MARYDKYDPISGGFRAILNADLVLTNGAFVGAVSLNASGLVVAGTAGQSGCVGVVVKNVARGPITQWATTSLGTANPSAPIGAMAGDVVDIMTSGEINDLDTTAFPAGSKIYAAASGALSTTGGTGKVLVGHTVEAGRLIVRVAQNLAILP